jgi:hypothetical protein
MPDYEIRCTTDRNKVYAIGPNIPNKEDALYIFNHTDARTKDIGPFAFDDTRPPTDHYLVERVGRSEATFVLYKAHPSSKDKRE